MQRRLTVKEEKPWLAVLDSPEWYRDSFLVTLRCCFLLLAAEEVLGEGPAVGRFRGACAGEEDELGGATAPPLPAPAWSAGVGCRAVCARWGGGGDYENVVRFVRFKGKLEGGLGIMKMCFVLYGSRGNWGHVAYEKSVWNVCEEGEGRERKQINNKQKK